MLPCAVRRFTTAVLASAARGGALEVAAAPRPRDPSAWRLEGRAEALLRALGARRISVDDAVVQRIRSCSDIALLDSSLERAVSVRAAEELFD